MSATTTPKPTICRRCGRGLRCAKSIELGYGPTCLKRVLAEAAAKAEVTGKVDQVAKAVELIRDGGVVLNQRLRTGTRVYRTVASKGTVTYLTTAGNCTCMAGKHGRACYHQTAVQLLAS